ncbi:hypothetical protein LCGC14_2916580, partial [marine sediment metagenome]
AELEGEVTAVYDAAAAPSEQLRHIPLAQLMKTRFVTVDGHNYIVGELEKRLGQYGGHMEKCGVPACECSCGWEE